MIAAPVPENETERIESLRKLNLLDTPPEERFDRITKTATYLFQTPISTITLVDSNREWFKSCQGLPEREGERAISFCGHAMLTEKDVFIIPDASKDPRFSDNPMVTGPPYIKFYAGVPLSSADGQRVGTLCVKDHEPREDFSEEKAGLLKALASWAELELNFYELSTALESRKKAEKTTLELNNILKLLNKIMRHDVSNDLGLVRSNLELVIDGKNDEQGIQDAFTAIERSLDLVDKMRDLEAAVSSGDALSTYNVREVIEKVITGYSKIRFTIEGDGFINADEAFFSVIKNIVSNADMHAKTDRVDIKIIKKGTYLEISIADYGKGIPDEVKKQLFQEGLKYGGTGHTGLGLYIVRKTVERYGGNVKVEDNNPNGTRFVLSIPVAK